MELWLKIVSSDLGSGCFNNRASFKGKFSLPLSGVCFSFCTGPSLHKLDFGNSVQAWNTLEHFGTCICSILGFLLHQISAKKSYFLPLGRGWRKYPWKFGFFWPLLYTQRLAAIFHVTVVGGIGEHGLPALKHVVGACRPQPGKLLHNSIKEGVLVVGSQRGNNTAIQNHVQEEC